MNSKLLAIVAASSLGTCGAVFATTVEMVSAERGGVQLRIDGRAPRNVYTGDLTPEGVYVRAISQYGEAKLRIRGVEETLSVGRTVAVSNAATGLPSAAVVADSDGKFISQFLTINQPFQVEIQPRQLIELIMPVADAERLKLPFKDEVTKPKPGEKPPKPNFPRPQKVMKKGKPYFNHFVELKSVRVGGIELFGVKAIVSEDPDLKRAIVGKNFLLQMDTVLEGSTLTMNRLP